VHRPTSARRSEHPLDRSDPKRRRFLLFLAAGLAGAAVGRGTIGLVDPTRAPLSAETAALREVLAAEHAAVWGYGTVGAALPEDAREPAEAGDLAHRDIRDRLAALLAARGADPVPREPGYTLPFPVLSAADAAALAVVLEEGVSAAWVWLLDQATQPSVRELAVEALGAAEVRGRVAHRRRPDAGHRRPPRPTAALSSAPSRRPVRCGWRPTRSSRSTSTARSADARRCGSHSRPTRCG
jgi:hypothetical protein